MRVLYLPIKKCWFDMILAGIKKEEYREKSAHWLRRISYSIYRYGSFTHVCFINGYQKDSPRAFFVCNAITQGRGKKEWGADLRKNYFIVRLGERVNMQFHFRKPYATTQYQ